MRNAIKHGHATRAKTSPEYRAWCHLKERCLTSTNSRYADYGGRGIKVCARWLVFENFLEDMGLKPTVKHSIDRINNDGDYTPENCRWATNLEQNLNKRIYANSKTGIKGVYPSGTRWKVRIYSAGKDIFLGYFDTLQEAILARKIAEQNRTS